MNCIIVDDEHKAIQILKRYVDEISFLNCLNTFRDSMEAVEYLRDHSVDLLLLDINMPGISGIDLIGELNYEPLIVFTTAYSNYAVQAFDLQVLDYLVKPVSFERFCKAMQKADNYFKLKQRDSYSIESIQPAYILIKSGAEIHKIHTDDIYYFEKEGNYLKIHLKNRKLLIRSNFGNLLKMLPSNLFIRAHKSFIVSITHFQTIERGSITLTDNIKIPVGNYYDAIINQVKFGGKGMIK